MSLISTQPCWVLLLELVCIVLSVTGGNSLLFAEGSEMSPCFIFPSRRVQTMAPSTHYLIPREILHKPVV